MEMRYRCSRRDIKKNRCYIIKSFLCHRITSTVNSTSSFACHKLVPFRAFRHPFYGHCQHQGSLQVLFFWQVLVVRQDLKMKSEKIASQCADAATGMYGELIFRYFCSDKCP
ncbi:hypothetical protein PIB30_057783 [Stylosanthes scabra]|uniref:peptidyl-tRNA hydrolase n=1 Tax=Stylosanthes scabra TaxID=79078 RepID=A0ABU6TJJ7_9FABA|nr:hypothetical protein [Stylosanthes scabra]